MNHTICIKALQFTEVYTNIWNQEKTTLRHALLDKAPYSRNPSESTDYDTKLLTAGMAESFYKQLNAIQNGRHTKIAFLTGAILVSAAAIATFVLGFFFIPALLFSLTGAMIAGVIVLSGLAIHQHYTILKKIEDLAKAIFPVRHQVVLASQYGLNTTINGKIYFRYSVPYSDRELISIAAQATANIKWELVFMKDMLLKTEEKRKTKSVDDAILLPLLRSSIPIICLRQTPYSQAFFDANAFYCAALDELADHPIPDHHLPLFKDEIIRYLSACESMIIKAKRTTNDDKSFRLHNEMIKMMQLLNKSISWDLIDCIFKAMESGKECDGHKEKFVKLLYRSHESQMKLIAQGIDAADVLQLEDLFKAKFNQIRTEGSVPEEKLFRTGKKLDYYEFYYDQQAAFQEEICQKIQQDPDNKESILKEAKYLANVEEHQSLEEFRFAYRQLSGPVSTTGPEILFMQ